MTGDFHYHEAERLLDLANNSDTAEYGSAEESYFLAAAQAHATLALAAATALASIHTGPADSHDRDREAWSTTITGERP